MPDCRVLSPDRGNKPYTCHSNGGANQALSGYFFPDRIKPRKFKRIKYILMGNKGRRSTCTLDRVGKKVFTFQNETLKQYTDNEMK
jgi:hypothetical protein